MRGARLMVLPASTKVAPAHACPRGEVSWSPMRSSRIGSRLLSHPIITPIAAPMRVPAARLPLAAATGARPLRAGHNGACV